MLWLVLATGLTVRTIRAGLPFAPTWWSFIFPVGACVTATGALAVRTGSDVFAWVAVVLYGALVVAWWWCQVSPCGTRTGTCGVGPRGHARRRAAEPEEAPSGATVLRGTVRTTAGGRPVSGARVTLLDPAGDVVAMTLTGEDGSYSFSDLESDRSPSSLRDTRRRPRTSRSTAAVRTHLIRR